MLHRLCVATSPLSLALALSACAAPPSPTPQPAQAAPTAAAPQAAPPSTAAVAIPNAAEPLPGVITGGQPSDADLEAAQAAGYHTVISLRAPGEPGTDEERARVEALGMRFVSIPVAGADDLTADNARKLAEALNADGARPLILHCGSGNRAGALLALEAFHVEGLDADAALELGKRAGLTKLEADVRERLQRE